MGRPGLALGTAGAVRVYPTSTGYRAMTRYRDWDGRVRSVERVGKTKGAATQALAGSLRDRGQIGAGSSITADTRVKVVVDAWWAEVRDSDLSPSTKDLYAARLTRQILPALGELRIRELTTGVVDRHLMAVKREHGSSIAKTTKSVLSGICRVACRYDAMVTNPCRDVSPISTKPKRQPRSLSVPEVQQLRAWLTYDDRAVRQDLCDFVAFMLATGARIGEASAVEVSDVDLANGTVHIHKTVLRVKGVGLIVKPTPKTVAGERILELPSWCIQMLRRRAATGTYLFESELGHLRDPHNSRTSLREALTRIGYAGVTSHMFRKTTATLMDASGRTAREIADQLGHSRVSQAQDTYLGRKTSRTGAANVLEVLAD